MLDCLTPEENQELWKLALAEGYLYPQQEERFNTLMKKKYPLSRVHQMGKWGIHE